MSKPDLTPGGLTWIDESDLRSMVAFPSEPRWSPFDIRLMLHFYYSPPTERSELSHAQIFPERVQDLENEGLIAPDSSKAGWVATEKGRALVDLWCNTPVPVVRYIDPRLGQ